VASKWPTLPIKVPADKPRRGTSCTREDEPPLQVRRPPLHRNGVGSRCRQHESVPES